MIGNQPKSQEESGRNLQSSHTQFSRIWCSVLQSALCFSLRLCFIVTTSAERQTNYSHSIIYKSLQFNYRQRGSDCTVLTATGLINGEWQILTLYRIETPKPIDIKFGTRNYVRETTRCKFFHGEVLGK